MSNLPTSATENRQHKLAPIFLKSYSKKILNDTNCAENSIQARKFKENTTKTSNKKIKTSEKPKKINDTSFSKISSFEKRRQSLPLRRSLRLKEKEVSKCNEDEQLKRSTSIDKFDFTSQASKFYICSQQDLNDDDVTEIYWKDINCTPLKSVCQVDELPNCIMINSKDDEVTILDVTFLNDDSEQIQTEPCFAWTEKYKPMKTGEVIGHKDACARLRSWLKDWNSFEECEMINNIFEENVINNSCLLLNGPIGCGKTSLVYALAKEFGYEVFEINASMKRSGKIILKQLNETIQSHNVKCNKDNSIGSIQALFQNVTVSPPENKISNMLPKNKIEKKELKNNKGILNYFTKIQSKKDSVLEECQIVNEKDHFTNVEVSGENVDLLETCNLTFDSNTLILFDDVDVLLQDKNYDDAIGFWNAINSIIETSKKPVILTSTQHLGRVKKSINNVEVIKLKHLEMDVLNDGLFKILDKDNEDSTNILVEKKDDLSPFIRNFDYDVRRCLNELQFNLNIPSVSKPTYKSLSFNKRSELHSFKDQIKSFFLINKDSEKRFLWHSGVKPHKELDYHSLEMANQINEFLEKFSGEDIYNKSTLEPEFDSCISGLSDVLPMNISNKTIAIDYFWHLADICESEFQRYQSISTHSRRSRRFLHHFDQTGFYIEESLKNMLVSKCKTTFLLE